MIYLVALAFTVFISGVVFVMYQSATLDQHPQRKR